ncbi:MAG: DUF6491 family protein [Alphaproteobacteria bacterium]
MKYLIAVCAAALLATACQSDGKTEKVAKKPDPRQGKEVTQVCFSQQIRNWRANDSHSVIIEKGLKQEYKLDLAGTCQPESAFLSIGLVSRVGGGNCLSNMDKLVTDSRFAGDGPCFIQHIYEWDKDAGKTPANATAAPATPSPR